jgi:membrane protein
MQKRKKLIDIVFPGMDGLSLSYMARFFVKGVINGAVPGRASSIAFNFFLALFPAVIFLFTLIPYIPVSGFQDQLLGIIEKIMPTNAYEAARSTIVDIVKHQRGGLLSFGFLFALYFSTNGINSIIEGFNKSYHLVETRSFFKQRVVALILTIILSILVLISISLMIFSETVLEYMMTFGLIKDGFIYQLLQAAKWIIILAQFFLGISFIYYLGPSRKMKWRFFSAGSILATLLCIIVSLGFTYFVNNFGQYNKVYGSIGTLIVVLLWIYFNSINLLLGFELNASVELANRKVKKKAEETIQPAIKAVNLPKSPIL